MLMVTIELLPAGSESLRRPIASMCIDNEGGLDDVSDYLVTAMELANPLTGTSPGFANASVSAHDPRRGIWSLLRKACEEIDKAGWTAFQAEEDGGQI
ncbi:hypothetical protein [Bradyrhizobium diazoefficiens]|uniref:Uncharacterized protein n=1 Tax=Bradyrhizobium diazoefficiens TaxID=1355477 RepID=A0A809ZR48_9BRAD|nr:hypothetical protein [Bradyrhizobium diazoefficiens]QLD45909.1 hypothetical protein HUW42_35140 [Bradyrhizobium diazoefficiens]WLA72243.1 hypothetical protein QIH77_35965 [Bradyrhizobium diazoefficiens]BBZ92742.1 hypothetical protein F07S3_25750 [Bradyrhizobium diazoefficiens]BCA10493.1 hypothetical protein BDHF08_23400 [Bradyrhizobium diazoefficiens]BCE19815.1 hypothetical protein XF1B_24960 [Bradyrhizobium diazoefficiens]